MINISNTVLEIKEAKVPILENSQVSYRLVGDLSKPTIIFLNGSIFNFKQFDPVMFPNLHKRLGDDFSYLFYDYLGIGESSDIIGEFDFLTIADQHIALMDALGIQNAHLIGFSKGAVIAFLTAFKIPQRILSIGVYGNPNLGFDFEGVAKKEFGKRLQNLSGISGLLVDRINETNFNIVYDTLYIPTIFGDKEKSELGLIDRIKSWWVRKQLKPLLIGTRIQNIKKLYEYYRRDIETSEMEAFNEAAKKLNVKTLIMHGSKDEIIPLDASQLMDSNLPNSRLVVFDKFDHTSPFLIKRKGRKLMNEYSKFINGI